MIDFIKNINREDIYSGIIPVFLWLIPFTYEILIHFTTKREWKKGVSKSFFDKYIFFQIRMFFIMYITVFIMAAASIISIYILLYNFYIIKNIDRFVKIIYSLVCAGLHIYDLLFRENKKERRNYSV